MDRFKTFIQDHRNLLIGCAVFLVIFLAGYICGLRYAAGFGEGRNDISAQKYLDRAATESAESGELNRSIGSENARSTAAIDQAAAAVTSAQGTAEQITNGISDSQGKLNKAADLNRAASAELSGAERILSGILQGAEKGKSQKPTE